EREDFLVFLIPMMIGGVCVGRVVRSILKKPDPQPGDDRLKMSWEETAYLAGGCPRLTTAAIARLIERGNARLEPSTNMLLASAQPDSEPLSLTEKVVFKQLPFGNKPVDLKPVQQAVEAGFASKAAELEDEGFTLSRSQQVRLVLASFLP